MKRLLLVTYGFPPVSRVQSHGAAKLATGLANRGWEVHVLTVADPPTFLFDERLAAELPESVRVHATYSLEPTRITQAFRRRRGEMPADGTSTDSSGSHPARSYTSLSPRTVRLLRALFFPEEKIGWSPWAVREAERLDRELRFDAIVSTGPPYTAHVIGRKVTRATGVPWLAVLMDPIVGCYAFPPVTPLHARLFRRLESQVASSASMIAAATRPWADALVQRNPVARDRVVVFPNGFDPADYADAAPGPHEGFLVAYVGTFQLSIRPDTFLDAVAELRRDPEIARKLRVRFVGPHDPQTDAAVAARGLENVVERTGLVGHREAVRHMRESDVLLFVLGPEPESADILTGKLPEYLAAGSAVLAEAPEGVATDLIRRAGAGVNVAPGDVAAMTQALRGLYAEWREGRLRSPEPDVVDEVNRERALDRLAAALANFERPTR